MEKHQVEVADKVIECSQAQRRDLHREREVLMEEMESTIV